MIRAGANQRQAQGDIDALLKAQVFHWNQALIMVHRHHHIELADAAGRGPGPHEHRVRRKRAMNLQALLLRRRHRWRDDVELFAAKQAALAGMRVQAGHGNAGRATQQQRQSPVGDLEGLEQPLKADCIQGLAQRQMNAHQHDAQLLVGQHHAHWQLSNRTPLMRSCQGLQHLGVARVSVVGRSGQCQCRFVQWRGHQRGNFTAQGSLGRPDHALPGLAPGTGRHLTLQHQRRRFDHLQYRQAAWWQIQCLTRQRQQGHRQNRRTPGHLFSGATQRGRVACNKTAAGHLRGIAKGPGDDLGADASWIAHGDGNRAVYLGLHGRLPLAHAGLSMSMN